MSLSISATDAGERTAGLALGLVGVLAFSLTLPMTRLAVSGFDAVTVMVWRGLFAALAASAILLVRRPPAPRRGDLGLLAAASLGVVVGFPLLMTLGMRSVSASHGGVVIGLLPIATAAVGALMARERPSPAFWLVGLAGTGVTVGFVLRQAEGGLEAGHLYLLGSVLASAVGYAAGAQLTRRLGGWQVICWSLAAALPFFALAALVAPAPSPDAPAQIWGALLYLALISQLAGFFAWYRGLALGGVARVSQVQLLQLFLTLIASALILGERLDAEIWLFGALTVALVALSARLRVSRAAPRRV